MAPGARTRARLGQLVAGREQSDRGRQEDLQARPTEARGDADVLGPETLARLQHRLAAPDVLAGPAAVGAAPHAGRDDDRPVGKLGILLHQGRIGAGRQRRAGQDTERCPRRQAPGEGVPGRRAAFEQPQPGRPIGRQIAMGEGEAVDRDVVEARHIALADQGLGEDPAMRPGERHGLLADHRPDPLLEQGERLARRHAFRIVGKTVVQGWP